MSTSLVYLDDAIFSRASHYLLPSFRQNVFNILALPKPAQVVRDQMELVARRAANQHHACAA